jgi:Mn2+/Fe2+ NRAMP family transporter
MLIGLSINFIGLNPIKALIYAAVANGIVAPLILCLIVLISSSKKIMGPHANKRSTTALGWSVTGVMMLAGVAAIVTLFK